MTALELRSFGVAFGPQVVLARVNLELPRTGMTVLVGPAGGGKSTLVRTLSGLNDAQPSLRTTGTVRALERPRLIIQHARFFLDTVRENLVSALPDRGALGAVAQTDRVVARLEAIGLAELVPALARNAVELPLAQQRRLALARSLMMEPAILFADEPTAALDDGDASAIVALLRRQAARRAVLLITHHQRSAREAGGTTLLLAGGRIQERAPTEQFFTRPGTEPGHRFVRTGGCVAPPPAPLGRAVAARRPSVGPRGFFWIIPGQLGGMPRPGIIDDLEWDLEGLAQLGVTALITLEETRTVPAGALAQVGVQLVHFPIPDMGVPDLAAAQRLCRSIDRWLAGGEVIAVHCRAGLGRTGTLLACQLIAGGAPVTEALETVRSINPRCVQSEVQLDFLRSFAAVAGMPQPPSRRARDSGGAFATKERELT